MHIWLVLSEFGVKYAKGSIAPSDIKAASDASVADTPIRFVDKDENKSAADRDVVIMLYPDAVYGQSNAAQLSKADLAKRFSRFQQEHKSAELWKRRDQSTDLKGAFLSELAIWDGYVTNAAFMCNTSISCIVDFTIWPVLHVLVEKCGYESMAELTYLKKYYESVAERDTTTKVIGKTE